MNIAHNPKLRLLIAAAVGAALTYGTLNLMADDAAQHQQLVSLENRILELEALLAQQEEKLENTHFLSFGTFGKADAPAAGKPVQPSATPVSNKPIEQPGRNFETAEPVSSHEQILKDLATLAYGDPRTFPEKVNDFLAENPGKENVAIASKSVFDLADNHDVLPNHSLDSIYLAQTDPDLKRVVAQVASLRGDNSLIEMQITEAQAGLKSSSPAERQKALAELAKTRYAGAASAIAPLLQDDDIGVKLDALLALRATGNQSHVHLVESLVNHPNESVSWLAKDVISNLQMLSDIARTRLASNEIVAELPPITVQ